MLTRRSLFGLLWAVALAVGFAYLMWALVMADIAANRRLKHLSDTHECSGCVFGVREQ
jgi:hypothetical protein